VLCAQIFMQGGVDHDGNLNARFHQGWTASHLTKVQMSVSVAPAPATSPRADARAQLSNTPGHSMIQLEQDYQGLDYSANLKAINPSPADLSGVYVGNYLQSITPRLALGVESLYQRPSAALAELSHSLLAKYTAADKSWIATAQAQPATGIVQATYYHRLGEKVDVAADLQMMAQPGGRRDALATLGAKWDLRMSTFRAQVDSSGKVSALLEQRFSPEFTFVVAGEIDHFKVCMQSCFAPHHVLIALAELGQSRPRADAREHAPHAGADGHAAAAWLPVLNAYVHAPPFL
jgi:mitochondrial import receptor subunit TOM40